MLDIIRSDSRGSADHGWLQARHTFSFAGYHDPERMQFGPLRVVNEDRIAPGRGFDTHPHRDMEIVTYLIDGELEHRDSLGNGSVIRPGELQRMTAGTGVLHSEFNPSPDNETHLLQIWILPERRALEPGYEQKPFTEDDRHNRWCLLGSRDGRDGSLTIHQDVELATTRLEPGAELRYDFAPGRRGFVQVVRGKLAANGEALASGDALLLADEATLELQAATSSELLLFDLA